MPKPLRKNADVNQIAHSIIAEATGDYHPSETTDPHVSTKDPAAVALGRKGGLKGGKARAASMTKKQRSAVAEIAASARWKKAPGEEGD